MASKSGTEFFTAIGGMREPAQKIRRTLRFGLTVARKGRP
jgi:hypothetical protein